MRIDVTVAIMAALLVGCGGPGRTSEAVVVFAAASLADAVGDIVARAGLATGRTIRTSFASTSTLAAQIAAGAPADVFLAADAAWMDDLDRRGLVVPESRTAPIGNRLVVVAPRDAPPLAGDALAPGTLVRALGPHGRLALGDPEFVPAGRYARAALERLGLWADLAPRLARAQDVRAALALVARGEAPLGIVYATDVAVAPAVRVVAAMPPDAHPPITYVFAILAGRDRPAVRAVFAWLTGADGLAIFERHGFVRS